MSVEALSADAVRASGDPARVSAWILPAEGQVARTFSLSGEERLRRALTQAGVTRVAVGESPEQEPSAPGMPKAEGSALVLRGDWIFDGRLIEALIEPGDRVLLSPDGRPVAARVPHALVEEAHAVVAGQHPPSALGDSFERVGPDDLVPSYTHQLRKRQPVLLLPLAGADPAELERQLFDASYKGITDIITKYVWPAPALPVVRACARVGVSPNAVTVASWGLVGLALWLFAAGSFGPGLAAAWLMTFLDTVDGKLARVTLRSSRIGHVLDHGLDIVHPPFWWVAFGLALPPAPWLGPAIAVAFGGYIVHRLVEGFFMLRFGIEIHSWRALDARFRLVTTRRNPNLVLLTVGWGAGRPDLGFAALALWTIASILFHLVRVAQAELTLWRGGSVHGWYEVGLAGSERDAGPRAAA